NIRALFRCAVRCPDCTADPLNRMRVEQTPGEECQSQHERKRQCHCAVENKHWHDVDVRIVEPRQRWDEKFGDLRHQHESQEKKEKNHLRPVTTKTSSK